MTKNHDTSLCNEPDDIQDKKFEVEEHGTGRCSDNYIQIKNNVVDELTEGDVSSSGLEDVCRWRVHYLLRERVP